MEFKFDPNTPEAFEELKQGYANLAENWGVSTAKEVLLGACDGAEYGIDSRAPLEAQMAAYVEAFKGDAEIETVCNALELTDENWFKAVNEGYPMDRTGAQFGCHLEEVAEMLEEVDTDDPDCRDKLLLAKTILEEVGKVFKAGKAKLYVKNHTKFCDSLVDQRVTAMGVGVCSGYNMKDKGLRVTYANFTKFVDSVPQYKDGGKVAKGPYFSDPDKGM